MWLSQGREMRLSLMQDLRYECERRTELVHLLFEANGKDVMSCFSIPTSWLDGPGPWRMENGEWGRRTCPHRAAPVQRWGIMDSGKWQCLPPWSYPVISHVSVCLPLDHFARPGAQPGRHSLQTVTESRCGVKRPRRRAKLDELDPHVPFPSRAKPENDGSRLSTRIRSQRPGSVPNYFLGTDVGVV